jgi:serine/threonine protein kinase
VSDRQPPGVPANDHPTEQLGASASEFSISVRNYRIRQLVATGGMGEVYEAEQLEPIRRRVALKVVKLGMDTREVIARFESERQALALMSHPNIAKVFDGGATEQGRPFFAMEFVQGAPITDFCDRYRLTIRERLELFLEACQGVQHAHQKGIIHRDIKPSNVLVAFQNDRPEPKIIDFGVAKATSQRLTEKTMVTALGAVIGTPEYMSPEQAELTGLDIDTRSDIYSLGMLLYELMAGTLPFDSQMLRRASLSEIQRRILEEEPPRPSTRLTTLGDSAATVAKSRKADVPMLARELRGDLDWIILKALEKDRTRRYETVNALALDIRRHLDDEPVRASPPSTMYRVRKFVRRHRVVVAAAVLVVAALVAGIVGTTLGLLRATRAEQRAQAEALTARQVSDFLVDLFQVSDPETAQGETITAREILDDGAARIENELADQPLTQAQLMTTIGTVYRQLGLYDQAAPLLERALELRRRHLGEEHLDTATSLLELSALMRRAGDYRRAAALAAQALEIRERRLGPEDPGVAETLASLGWSRASINTEGIVYYDEKGTARTAITADRIRHHDGEGRVRAQIESEGITYYDVSGTGRAQMATKGFTFYDEDSTTRVLVESWRPPVPSTSEAAGVPSDARLVELEVRDVAEVRGVERPQPRAVDQSRCRNRQVRLAASGLVNLGVEPGGDFGLFEPERDRLLTRHERLLRRELLALPRSTEPLEEHQRRHQEPVAVFDRLAQCRRRAAGPGECVHQHRRVENDHLVRFVCRALRPPVRRLLLISSISASTSSSGRSGISGTYSSKAARSLNRSASESRPTRAPYS